LSQVVVVVVVLLLAIFVVIRDRRHTFRPENDAGRGSRSRAGRRSGRQRFEITVREGSPETVQAESTSCLTLTAFPGTITFIEP